MVCVEKFLRNEVLSSCKKGCTHNIGYRERKALIICLLGDVNLS
ncbi:hypothetical protein MGSAQ_000209 [marine sediment metagenome]|uniref:Uncharacterized protein n=1 Tax=marine sediment metagenome TaxID=412755 RepID=A0A1B6NXZ4_9ZZZZ